MRVPLETVGPYSLASLMRKGSMRQSEPGERLIAAAKLRRIGVRLLPGPGTIGMVISLMRLTEDWPLVLATSIGLRKRALVRLRSGEVVDLDTFGVGHSWVADPRLIRARAQLLYSKKVEEGDGWVSVRLDRCRFAGELERRGLYRGRLKFWFDTESERCDALRSIESFFLGKPGHPSPRMYANLNVAGRSVVDIGANIGDSALYLAARGASHVFAFEPVPTTYRVAKRNIESSPYASRVTLVNEACGSSEGSIKLNAGSVGTKESVLANASDGVSIRVRSLTSIVEEYGVRHGVLKANCEGCEYGIIGGAATTTLRKFDSIRIAYHFGIGELPSTLRAAGFRVDYTRPVYSTSENPSTDGYMLVGSVHAHLPS